MSESTDGYLYNGETNAPQFTALQPRADVGLVKRVVDFLFKSAQDRPNFGKTSYFRDDRFGWGLSGWFTQSDFTKDAGPLDGSSLVMSIVNDSGIAIAEALPNVRRRNKENKWEMEPDHPLAELINQPNPFFIWPDYCKAGALSWWIDGNWYSKKVRDASGQVSELWYLPHYLVDERWPGDGRSPEVPANEADNAFLSHYQYTVPGKAPEMIKRDDVLHIKNGVDLRNPRRGIGVFGSVLREICGDNAVAAFSATLMKNMGMVPYLLSPKEKDVSLDETQANAIKEKWMQRTSGANIGQPVVNAIPLEVTKLGFNPQELDLSKLRTIFESRIAAVSRYPAAYLQFLVGLENGTSYASYKQAREQAYEAVIIPIQTTIGKQINRYLMPEFEKKKGAEFFFDTSEVRVLEEDKDALFKRESEALRAGGRTLNDFLTATGKDPIPEGDIYLVPSTSTPMSIEKLKNLAEDITPPAQPPPIDPASLAKFAEMERMFEGLESQMKGFELPQ